MKYTAINAALALMLGQMVLFLLLYNDPGSIDSFRDFFIGFLLIPLLPVSTLVIYNKFRPAQRIEEHLFRCISILLLPIIILLLLAISSSLSSLVQIIIALSGGVLTVWLFWRIKSLLPVLIINRYALWVFIGIIALNGILLIRGNPPPQSEAPEKPVLFYGVDGADWKIIDSLTAKGQLPALSACLSTGCRADLYGSEPIFSPILWTTIATGKPPAEHGLFAHTTDLDATLIRCRRIWDIVEQNGKSCGAVQYLGLWPLGDSPAAFVVPSIFEAGTQDRPVGYGFIARTYRDLKEGRFTPGLIASFWLKTLRYGMRISTATYCLQSIWITVRTPTLYRRSIMRYRFYAFLERLHTDLFCHLYRKSPTDLAIYYNPTVDGVEHLYFRPYQPEAFRAVDFNESKYLGQVIPDVYREADRTLTRLIQVVGKDANVIIVSDHGMQACPDLVQRGFSRVYSGQANFPELLGYSKDQVDWLQGLDRIYLCPKTEAGTTYLDVMNRARGVRLATSGRPVWAVGFRDGDGRYQSELTVEPDNPGFIELSFTISDSIADSVSVIFPAKTCRISDFTSQPDELSIQGAHNYPGIFIAYGPDVLSGIKIASFDQLDIAPILLALLGVPGAEDMRPLPSEILTPDKVLSLPHSVRTYENPPWIPIKTPCEIERDAARNALRDQMRARGYLN